MIKKSLLYTFPLIFLAVACQNKQPAAGNQSDTAHIVANPDTLVPERVIDNFYTRISDSLCPSRDTGGLAYTNKNTTAIPLYPGDSSACFVFASEVTCGYMPGSCGRDIQVIKKKDNGYYSVFSACGFVYNMLNEQNEGIHAFIYGTQDGYKIKVSWDGAQFSERSISVNDIAFNYVMALAEATHRNPTDFVLYNPKKEEGFKVPVRIEDIAIGPKQNGKIFTIMFDKAPEIFLFAGDKGSPKMILSGRGNFTLKTLNNSGKEFYDIITTPARNTSDSQVWRYDKQKQKYVPKV